MFGIIFTIKHVYGLKANMKLVAYIHTQWRTDSRSRSHDKLGTGNKYVIHEYTYVTSYMNTRMSLHEYTYVTSYMNTRMSLLTWIHVCHFMNTRMSLHTWIHVCHFLPEYTYVTSYMNTRMSLHEYTYVTSSISWPWRRCIATIVRPSYNTNNSNEMMVF